MWQHVRDWAFPEPSPGEGYRSRWHRFTREHGGLILLGGLPILAAIYAGLFGTLYVLEYVHLLEPLVWAWVGIFVVGTFFWILKAFR